MSKDKELRNQILENLRQAKGLAIELKNTKLEDEIDVAIETASQPDPPGTGDGDD